MHYELPMMGSGQSPSLPPCPYCEEGVLERGDARGLLFCGNNPKQPNCSQWVTISESIELPLCRQCDGVFPEPSDEVALAPVLVRSWEILNRPKLGLRIHVDDELSLGVAWAPCQSGKPLRFFLFGLVISLGMYQGDRPRVVVYSLRVWDLLLNALKSPDQRPARPIPEGTSYRWEARFTPWHTFPLRSWGGIEVPEYFGIGVSLYVDRAWYHLPSWAASLYVGPWKMWIGKVVRRNPLRGVGRPRKRKRRAAVQGSHSDSSTLLHGD